jgi:hypothetical protein
VEEQRAWEVAASQDCCDTVDFVGKDWRVWLG